MMMSLIFCALVYVFISSRFVAPMKIQKIPNISRTKPKEVLEEQQGRGIEVIEISGKNESELISKRIKRLDSDEGDRSPDSQKLIFFPSRTLKSPRISERSRVVNYSPANHRMSSRMSEPRPFNHMISGPKPNGFQRKPIQSTARTLQQQRQQVQNIQDIIQHNQYPVHQPQQTHRLMPARLNVFDPSSLLPVQLAGTYRNPRNNGELTQMFNPNDYHKHPTNPPEILMPDPFYNFKPQDPLEINQMAMNGMNGIKMMPTVVTSPYFRRKFSHQIASIPNYNIRSKDVTGIYQNVLNSGRDFHVDRVVEEPKKKPFSMMLDFYPMAGGGNDIGVHHQQQRQHQTQIHHQQPPLQPNFHQQLQYPQQNLMQHASPSSKSPRLKPFQGYYQDPTLFNTMQFPQLTPRYPAFFRFNQPHHEASNNHPVGLTKPSQLVVHLNLFPKNKVPTFKRSSNEEQIQMRKKVQQQMFQEKFEVKHNETIEATSAPVNINFNVNTGNGHPENVLHQGNMPQDPYHNFSVSTESSFKPTYYYDDSEDDQSLAVAPSLVYHNIHRERPIQLMLTNSTTTEPPLKKLKNHKLAYKTIERPRKQNIKNETRKYGNAFQ